MAKTKWTIEADNLTIYPSLIARTLSIIYFIAASALIITLFINQNIPLGSLINYEIFILVTSLVLFGVGGRHIFFDGINQIMSVKVFGIAIKNIPFNQIGKVTSYSVAGSYCYKIFTAAYSHGRGIAVSAGYSKATDQNLIAYQQEVLPKIDQLVFASQPLIAKPVIYDFKYFKEENGVYKVKSDRVASLIFGILLIGVTPLILNTPDFMSNDSDIKRILVTYFPLVIGLVLASTFFRSVKFDKNSRQIIHKSITGLKVYSYNDFIRFLIVRKTTNLIYSGTEIKAEIYLPETKKVKVLFLTSFWKTKKVQRFIDETNTILGKYHADSSASKME